MDQLWLRCCDEADIMPFYEDHLRAALLSQADYRREFSSYIGWLETTAFMQRREGRYYITELGNSFLHWMVAEGLTHRPGL